METVELTASIYKQITKSVVFEKVVTGIAGLSEEVRLSVELTQTLSQTVSMYEMGKS